MGRKKMQREDKRLTHLVSFRVTEDIYKQLARLEAESDCHSLGEVARRIISKERIMVFYKDTGLIDAMEELSAIRKELNAIGVNINQITRHFHSVGDDKLRLFFAIRATDLYKTVGLKVDQLLTMVSQMTIRWLQS